MKFRFAFSAFCMLVAMTMATGAFAQGVFTVSSGIEPRGRSNGHAEEAGGVTLFLNSGVINTDDTGTVVLDYGVDITNGVDPTDDANGITVNICSDPTRLRGCSTLLRWWWMTARSRSLWLMLAAWVPATTLDPSTLKAFCSLLWGRAQAPSWPR